MCACTEPVGTGTGAVCVECGRPKWPIIDYDVESHTYTHLQREKQITLNSRMTREEGAFFFLGKPKKNKRSGTS